MKDIKTRRIQALYNYKNNSSSNQKELLELLLAIIPHSIVKQTVEELNIKLEDKQWGQ